MPTKLSKILIFLLIASLAISGCTSQKVKIVSVERVNSIGYEGMPSANARPGYDILLIEIETNEEISPFEDLVLKDSNGNSYSTSGLISGRYIFEIPESTGTLTLVVKDTIEVPLP